MTPWSAPLTPAAAMQAARLAAEVPEIATDRLRLRAPRLDDFAVYAEIATSDRAAGIGGPMTEAGAWDDFCRMVATWLLRGHGVWTVEEQTGGNTVGFVLIGFEPGDAEPELGYLFRATAEGQGYATEAAAAARDHGFARLRLPALVSYVAPDNLGSRRVASRLGAVADARPFDGSLVFRHSPTGGCA